MFYLAKFSGVLVAPLTWVLALWILCGISAWARRSRTAVVCAVSGFALLLIASLPATARLLATHLERRYPAVTPVQAPSADAIVVLGGAVSGASAPARPTLRLGPASTRLWHAALLHRAGKAPWVIVAGGNQPGHESEQVEAEAMAEVLTALGVPPDAIRAEKASRNTWENARNSLPIVKSLKARKVLLVTSAIHMPRALATFEKAWAGSGIEILPAATDVAAGDRAPPLKLWIPDASALAFVTRALREYAGLLAISTMR